MSLSVETSSLTLAYINTSSNVSQINNNIRDFSNNLKNINTVVNDLFNKLNISVSDISGLRSTLIDISNNLV
jgi:hypothetical protein